MPNNRHNLALLNVPHHLHSIFNSKFETLASQLERCAGPSPHPFTSPCSSCPQLLPCRSLWDSSTSDGISTIRHLRRLQKAFSAFRKLKDSMKGVPL